MDALLIPTVDDLTAANVRELAAGRVLAIWIPSFVPAAVAGAAAAWMETMASDDYFIVADRGQGPERLRTGVRRVGCPLNELAGRSDLADAYQAYAAAALDVRHGMEAACRPARTPMEGLMDALGAAWVGGARQATMDAYQLFAGMPRIVEPHATLLESQPHVDAVHPRAFGVEEQISANLYLDVPTAGGELEVWPLPPLMLDEMLRPDLFDRLHRDRLGSSVIMAPAVGDLIVINSRRPHAVRQFDAGRRFSVQCFIGVPRDDREPLVLWS